MSNILQASPHPEGDPIAQLPVDQIPPNNNEMQIINTLFKKHRGTMDTVADEMKSSVYVMLFVILFSLKQVDDVIMKFIPITQKSPYILILIKGIAAGAMFWIFKHFYLSRT